MFFLFSLIFFLLKNFIFVSEDISKTEEEIFEATNLDVSFEKEEDFEINFTKIYSDLEKITQEQNQKKIIYTYIPSNFVYEAKTLLYKKYFDTFFFSKPINEKIQELWINIYKEDFEVRWRLKDKKIHIFWLYWQSYKEALSVAVHEFWHFLDLYILKKNLFKDISFDFYDISWEQTDILKAWNSTSDFVSGYAMTNKYEDFAESFTFYVLHNFDFLKKAEKSEKLQEKYNFFKKYVFINWEFITDEFSTEKAENYLWDTTKIDFNFEKFSNYLETL